MLCSVQLRRLTPCVAHSCTKAIESLLAEGVRRVASFAVAKWLVKQIHELAQAVVVAGDSFYSAATVRTA